MEKLNPFKQGHPPLSAPAPAGGGASDFPEPPPGALCPFMGSVTVPIVDPKAVGLIKRPDFNPLDALQMGVAFQACQGVRCHFWHGTAQGACTLKLAAMAQVDAAAALADLKVLLAPLGSFFQSRR